MNPRTSYALRIGGAVVLLGVLVTVINVASHGAFLEPTNLVRVLRQITYNCVLGVGQTFVIVTGGIDLSVGSLASLTGVVGATFANSVHLTGFPLIAATLAGDDFGRRGRRLGQRRTGRQARPSAVHHDARDARSRARTLLHRVARPSRSRSTAPIFNTPASARLRADSRACCICPAFRFPSSG